MTTVRAVLSSEGASGVYLVDGTLSVDYLRTLMGRGSLFFYIDGKEIHSKKSFFNTFATALNFPSYFGHNWDAFDECFVDLSWVPAATYVLLYDNFDAFAERDPKSFRTALTIFESGVAGGKESGTPMYVFLRGNGAVEGIRAIEP